jgi:hypothetical protein
MSDQKKRKKSAFIYLFYSLAWICFTSAIIFLASASYNHLLKINNDWNEQLLANQILDSHQANDTGTLGQTVTSVVESEDARAELIAKFLERHNSPMTPYIYYGQKLVEIADRHGLDFRLLPAIAMQESNLCRATNPKAPNNCLGFGIHSRGTLDFESYEAGFERAGRELKQNYIDQGLDTVSLIESKYTPFSNGSWANSVNQWMAEIRYNDRDMGRSEKVNTSVLEFTNKQ